MKNNSNLLMVIVVAVIVAIISSVLTVMFMGGSLKGISGNAIIQVNESGENFQILPNQPQNFVTLSTNPTSHMKLDSGGRMVFNIFNTPDYYSFQTAGVEKLRITGNGSIFSKGNSLSLGNGGLIITTGTNGSQNVTTTEIGSLGAMFVNTKNLDIKSSGLSMKSLENSYINSQKDISISGTTVALFASGSSASIMMRGRNAIIDPLYNGNVSIGSARYPYTGNSTNPNFKESSLYLPNFIDGNGTGYLCIDVNGKVFKKSTNCA